MNQSSTLPVTRSAEDHVRAQFENLHRKPELASELACFRPGNTLSSIRFIAHPHGLHVARWLKILAHTQATVAVDTANPVPAFTNEFVSSCPALPTWMNRLSLPMTIRYFLSGFALRFARSGRNTEVVHAHAASGSGTVAWLSGRRYLIGTYGSEIYDAKNRGVAYRWLLKRILQNAERISVCSDECSRILIEQYDIPPDRLFSFDLGYDEATFVPFDQSRRMALRNEKGLPADEPVWVVNRRTDPHYRTANVVEGFFEYCKRGGRGQIVLLCGDHKPEYTAEIVRMIAGSPFSERVTVVKNLLPPHELGLWLQLGDFSISVPRTDNFSISTLESMGCGTVPILADLEAYRPLKSCAAVRWMTRFEPRDFADIFAETAKSCLKSGPAQRMECARFVRERFSTENAIRKIASFYLGQPLNDGDELRNAA